MKQSLIDKLQQLVDRSEEIGGLLSDPDVIGDQNRFRDLSVEFSQLEPVVALFRDYEQARNDDEAAQEMLRRAKEELAEERYESIPDAARAVAEKALELSQKKPGKHGIGRR